MYQDVCGVIYSMLLIYTPKYTYVSVSCHSSARKRTCQHVTTLFYGALTDVFVLFAQASSGC